MFKARPVEYLRPFASLDEVTIEEIALAESFLVKTILLSTKANTLDELRFVFFNKRKSGDLKLAGCVLHGYIYIVYSAY